MVKPDSWWERSIGQKDSGWARAFMILWIDKTGLMCKCGHLSDSHFHECIGFGGNWITNTIYFDANGNLILNKPPFIRDGGIIKQEVFGSDGLVHWQSVTPAITNCAVQPNCK